MTFEEWFNEIEGYSFRQERFWDDYRKTIKGDLGDDRLVDWLKAAYNEGVKSVTVPITAPIPTPPWMVPTPSTPTIPDFNHTPHCRKCGMSLGGVMGYVCGDPQCPTFKKVYCGQHSITSADTNWQILNEKDN